MKALPFALALPLALVAGCGGAQSGDGPPATASSSPVPSEAHGPFAVAPLGTFEEPWALAFAPGTQVLFVTERPGALKFVDLASGRAGTVSGIPQVAYGGQGGLGDVAFLPSEAGATLDRRTIYLTWAEAGEGDVRGAVLGRGTLVCAQADACRIDGLQVIWRQQPKVAGFGHYSHKIAIAPDGKHLFLSSGERQKGTPAQDLSVNLGKVLRLNLDGTPAAGNPFWDKGGVSREIWSYGHRNLLGLAFDRGGQLWDLEHGPAGGDEINRVVKGDNYGWPLVSNGDDYDGTPIPDHDTRPEFHAPAISWNPVIAPGDFLFYSGKLWPEWAGQALIANLKTQSIVRVTLTGDSGTEAARTAFDKRLRDIAEGPDGALYVIEDGKGARLLRLTPG